jgi:hypothetical protein
MNNKIVLIALLLVANSVLSQKQTAGAQTVELEFAPLGSEPLKINSLRYRYFKTENTAYRLSLFLGGKSKATLGDTTGGVAQTKSRNSNFDFSIKPGIEKHFSGTAKLSPYYGGELFFGLKNTKDNAESNWTSDKQKIETKTTKTSKASFGLNVLMGTDFYATEHLYLGAEIGFGFLTEGLGKTKISYENAENTGASKPSETKGNTRETNWGPNYQGTIRLGWRFN